MVKQFGGSSSYGSTVRGSSGPRSSTAESDGNDADAAELRSSAASFVDSAPAASTPDVAGHDDDDSDDNESSRPGAYHVPGRALGGYPAWGNAEGPAGRREDAASNSAAATDNALAGGTAEPPPQVEFELAERFQQSIAAFLVDEESGATATRQDCRPPPNTCAANDEECVAVEGQGVNTTASDADADNSRRQTTTSHSSQISRSVPIVDGVPVPYTTEQEVRGKSKLVHTRSLFVLAAVALAGVIIGLSIAFAGGSKSDPASQDVSHPNEPEAGKNTSPLAPPNGTSSNEETESVEHEQPSTWKMIGSPIHGLRNQFGAIIHIDPQTGQPSLVTGYPSNFTLSGYSLALSDNGSILAVGEAGTDTVRVFEWEAERQDWTQKGQTLMSHWHETDCANDVAIGDNVFDCYVGFGLNLELSGDGSLLIVVSPGIREGRSILTTFQWETSKSEWIELDSVLGGDDPNDGLGGAIKMTPDGGTMACVAAQSLHDDFAPLFGAAGYTGRGYAKVFDLVELAWVQRGEVIRGRKEDDGLGFIDIAENGQSIAVGTFFGGYVGIYDWDGTLQSWVPRGGSLESPLGEIDFGAPILFSSPDGNRVVVGSTYAGDDVTTADANLIYVYEWTGSSWVQLDRLVVMESDSGYVGRFNSMDVSSDGSRLVAAFTKGSQMYQWNGRRYVQMGEYVEGGRTIAISRNGEVFAVGRPFDNSLGLGMGRTTTYVY